MLLPLLCWPKRKLRPAMMNRERYRDYPSAAKEAPQYCVTNLTSAPGKSQTYEFYGLPDVNNLPQPTTGGYK